MKTKTYRTKDGVELVYTPDFSETPTTSCVVLLPGMPYNPEKEYDIKTVFKVMQHDVYTIHYEGTWGSSGIFLAHNPSELVNELIEALLQGTISSTEGNTYDCVFVIGTSFGGGLALTLKDQSALKAICVLSPVISYKSVNGIKTLSTYLQNEATEHYAVDEQTMKALITDQIISPEEQMEISKEKIIVFAGEQDDQIPLEDIKIFCSRHAIELHTLPVGHITFGKVDASTIQAIADFFSVRAST